MVDIQFVESKSGSRTCIAKGVRLHSAYDPVKEAERFVEGIQLDFVPGMVVITEPALSYCSRFLRKKFPQAILVAIRFSNQFDFCNQCWDRVFPYTAVHQLLTTYGEDLVLSTAFLSWQPSQQVFQNEYNRTWESIRSLVQTSRNILGTRAYFGRRWLKNTLSFCYKLRNSQTLARGASPVLLAASGPSLKSSLGHIRKHREKVFLIAISSGLSPLLSAGIEPDLCISTDGGYWARRHIDRCPVPLALPAEAAVPGQCFAGPIIPLRYGDGPEGELLDSCGITALQAKRNGTVSGTALELALSITSGPVFACGLDLCQHVGFQHCQPNQLEIHHMKSDMRLAPRETRLFPQQLPTKTLEIYARWFESQSQHLSGRFFRLAAEDSAFSNSLGHIRDISWKDFARLTESSSAATPLLPSFCPTSLPDADVRLGILKEKLSLYREEGLPESWLATLAPAEQALKARSLDRKGIEDKIGEKSTHILEELISYVENMGKREGHAL